MQGPQGWQALSSISAFMQHVQSRKQLKVFGELDARLDYCEYLIRRQSNKNDIKRFRAKKRKDELGGDLVRALQSLSFEELIRHFNTLVQQLVQLTLNVFSPPAIESKSFIICEAYSRTYSLRMWKKKKLRFDRQNHIIYAEKDKKIKIYDLANYIVRSTEKTDYFGLALQAINNTPSERSKSAHFGFQYKNTYNLWLSSIQRSVEYKQWQALVFTLNKEQLVGKRNTKQGRDKEWERLNKTQGHCDVNEEVAGQEMQSAIYIPPPREEDVNQTTTTKGNNAPGNQQDEDSVLVTSFKMEQETDFEVILKQSHVHKLTHFDYVYNSLEDLQFQLQTQEDVLKKNKLQLSFANAIIDQYDSITMQDKNVAKFDEIMLADLNQVEVLQNKQKSCHFKVLFTINLKQARSQDLVQSFLNLDIYKVMNPTISSCSTKAVIYSQNSTLIHEQHHPYNRLYRPRQFYYIRHLTRTTYNEFLIIDRSIANSVPLPTNITHVRGQLTNIYKINADQERVNVKADIELHHNGGISQDQNAALGKKYILGLAHGLSQYLQSSIGPVSPSKYYSLETHTKHISMASQQSSDPQIAFNYKIDEQHPSTTVDTNMKSKPKASFYRIARNQIIQNTSLTESFFADEEPRHVTAHFRRALSPNRNIYIENRSSKIPQNTIEEQWNMESQPRDEWEVDEERGGMAMKRTLSPKEREVMKRIIQAAVKKALMGKDVDDMSFPVDILAPQTQLQRLMSQLCCAPALFTDISHLTVKQKLIKTVVSGLQVSLLSLYDERAFSSALGETYQCRFSPQCNGYAQQISSSPGISALYLVGNGFSLSAVLRQRFRMAMNSVSWKLQLGEDEICFTTPLVVLNGITLSRREFLLQERSFYWIEGHNIVLQLNFEPTNSFSQAYIKRDYFQGTIHEVTPQFMREFISDRRAPLEHHIVRVVGKITGRWTKDMHFQDQAISLSEVPLSNVEISPPLLPSDSCYRMDVSSLSEGRLQQSQSIKDGLQEQQRRDAIMRLTPLH